MKYAIILFLMSGAVSFSQERTQARSMVITKRGIVATSQTLASQAGAMVLARGGSAVDAAIAANAALTVVEPMMNGMGGDLFAIVREATGKMHGVNASGWSPKRMTAKSLRDQGHSTMPEMGIHSVTVPGCVEGWQALHKRFGKLPWAELFRPAIYYAENGFPVTEVIHDNWTTASNKVSGVFLPGGKVPEIGQVYRNAALAGALKLVAGGGADAFYRGPIAKAIVRTSDKLGGTMDAADLAEFQAEWVEPISTEYRGWRVWELPPNGQGIAALEMLNIMERFRMGSFAPFSPEALHYRIEAQKLAYEDLRRYLADPRFGKLPVAGLLSKDYAAARARLIDANKANCSPASGTPPPSAGDTIYLSAVDADGNIVSLIQSIYLAFGTGIEVEGMGFHLHNRGGLFVLDEKHPNVMAPRKRPFHTIIPGFMEKDNLHVGFGIMGGLNQAQAHAQFVSYVTDHGMNIQAALEAPRFTKLNFGGCDVMIESRVPEATRAQLTRMGHVLDVRSEFSGRMGGGQAVMHDSKTKVNYGASSPRKDGAAIPQPDPYF
jgi:gamma-glutamyltranspeptidase/glutathione hydrolase